MKNTLKKCPRCGSSLIKYTNKNTNKYFTKCSNKECHFSLRDNYYEEEVSLQGIKLHSKCLGCGHPLEVTCGPLGLYARCYHCNYDSTPHCVNGELVIRWANAYPQQVKDEINNLIIQYKKKNEAQIGFEEEYYTIQSNVNDNSSNDTSQNLEKELVSAGFNGKTLEDCTLILEVLMQDTSKPLTSKDIFEILKDQINSASSIVNYLRALRNSDFIKIVKYEEVLSSVKIYYQVKNSPLKEEKVYLESEGYASISSFFKKSDFYSTTMRTQVARVLRSSNEPTFLVQHERGFYSGYKVETLEKIIQNLEISPYKKDEDLLQKTSIVETTQENNKTENNRNYYEAREYKEKIRQRIIEILEKDINTGYTTSKVTEILKLEKQTVVDSVRTLKRQKRVKIIGTELHKEQGNYSFIFQLAHSPLKQVTIKSSVGCITLKDFLIKHKLNIKNYQKMLKKVRDNQLQEHLVLIHKRPYAGYKESELEKLFEIKKVVKISAEPRNTKKTTKTTAKLEVSPQVTRSPKEDKNFLSNVLKLFRKKEKSESPEIIHF